MRLKVFLEPRLCQHSPGVAADGEHLPGLDLVMSVEHVCVFATWDGALVNDGLSIVLAVGLQTVQLPETVACGKEPDLTKFLFQLGVRDGDDKIFIDPGVQEAAGLGQIMKVVPIQRSRDALSPQYLVILQSLGHAATRVDIGEVDFSARVSAACNSS